MSETFSKIAFAEQGKASPSSVRIDHKLSIRRQCELLGIQRSEVYYKPTQPSDEEVEHVEQIMERMDYWHTTMPYLGSRRLAAKLAEEGIKAGRKLVRRLMGEMGICAVYPKPNLSKCDFKEGIVPYLLRNKFVYFPNQVWSIDITYIKMHRGHMYLTAIIDWYSRMIVGWTFSDTLDTFYVIQTVREAVERHGTPSILNSDQGSQFTSNEYKALLKELHITQSMDGKSRWADNVMIVRRFRSLKTEEIYINEYASPRELRKAIREYIRQYNTVRPHEALDYKTPKQVYENCFLLTSADLDSLSPTG